MNVNLPRKKDGCTDTLSLQPGCSAVVIGANGAGKTRFTSAIVEQLGEKAFRISALDGLYERRKTASADFSLRSRCDSGIIASLERTGTSPNGLEILLAQLMHEEMLNLIGYKLRLANGGEGKLKRTKLDKVIELWQDIFPDNKVLIDSGKILFARGIDPDIYSALKLSDGEKTVLYYAGAILYAPEGAVIFVDSPEMFLHPTLTASLWNRLERLRHDCAFCYTTHDPEFASSRNQRNRIVSNKGKLVIDKTNNPFGVAIELDFGVPTKNIIDSKWYKRATNGTVTQNTTVGKTIIPIEVMQDVKDNAEQVDFAGPGHWECSKKTWRTLAKLDYFRSAYVLHFRPDISDAGQQLAFGKTIADSALKAFIEDAIGASIVVIDNKEFVEKFNPTTRKVETKEIPSFEDDVLVYVPDGAIGDVQCGKPIYMETPGARVSLYDGGRTLIRQVFNDENMVQVVKSEVTGLCVPNKTRHMYYLNIQG